MAFKKCKGLNWKKIQNSQPVNSGKQSLFLNKAPCVVCSASLSNITLVWPSQWFSL